jgi:hypothetical protein
VKLAVVFPDAERLVRALLADLIAEHEDDVTVGVDVPGDWTPASPPHLQVVWDGTPSQVRPVIARCSVRVVARAASTSRAKELAALAEGLLCAYAGGDGIVSIQPLAGVLPARDPDTHAELASITVRVTVRSTSIPDGS